MKIGMIHIKNIKAARELRIYGADLMQLAGPNGSGKSSFWDGFEMALCGAGKVGDLPVRRGKKKAESVVYLVYDENAENFNAVEAEDTADLIVTRRFTEKNQHKGGTLTISARDDSKWGQTMLDQIYDATMFSPPDIATRLPGEAKAAFERRVAGAFCDLAGPEFVDRLRAKDAELKKAKEDRADANRDLKRLGTVERLEKVAMVDVDALTDKLREAREWNAEVSQRRDDRKEIQATIDTDRMMMSSLRRQIDDLVQTRDRHADQVRLKEASLADLPDPGSSRDTTDLQNRRDEATATNERAAAYQRSLKKLAKHRDIARVATDAEDLVEQRTDERQELLGGVDLGVEGLVWDGESTTLNGIPWSEFSTGERWMVAIQIVIAREKMLQKPPPPGGRLKAILIRQASLIDKKNFPEIVQFANGEGWQICAEAVDPRGGDVLMIEDGEPRDIEF